MPDEYSSFSGWVASPAGWMAWGNHNNS